MDKNNRNLLIAGIAIVVVIALAIIIPHLKGSSTDTTPVVDTTTSAADTTTAPATSTDAQMAMWMNLFQKYNGKIVVFADNCQATPGTQTQSKGTIELLMNNSATPHIITVGGISYKIGAYHYKTTMLSTAGANSINCDTFTNVASIVVQG